MGGAALHDRVGQWLRSLKHRGAGWGSGNDFIGRWLIPASPPQDWCLYLSITQLPRSSVFSISVWSTLGRVPSPPTYETWAETGAHDGKPVIKVLWCAVEFP